jgi:chromate reductase
MKLTVAAFSGSLRKESFNTKLAKAFQKLAPNDITVNLVGIAALPLMNEDLEKDLPQSVKELHRSIESADAVLLVTPEYNRSYSPAIKNALDWGSRPPGKNKWNGKPCSVVGCTPYALGAFGAQNHLRQVLVYLNMPALQQPEFYLASAAEKFDGMGELTDADTRKRIEEHWQAFVRWIDKTR